MKSPTHGAVLALGIAQCVAWGILYYALAMLIGPLSAELGLRPELVAGMASIAALCAALLAAPVGRLLDHGDPARLLALGTLVGALACLWWARAESAADLLIAAIGLGVSQAFSLYEPAFSWVRRHAVDAAALSRRLLTVTLLGGLASTAFLPLTQALVARIGWRDTLEIWALVLVGVPALVYVGLMARGDAAPEAQMTPAAPVDAPQDGAVVWRLAVLAFVGVWGTTLLATHLPGVLIASGHSAERAAWAAGFVGAMQLVGRIGIGVARHDAEPRLMYAAAHFVLALSLLGAALLLGSAYGLYACLAGVGASAGLLTLLRPLSIARLFAPRRFGAVNGRVATAVHLARIAGPVSGSAVLAATRSPSTLLMVTAAVIGLLSAALLARPLRAEGA